MAFVVPQGGARTMLLQISAYFSVYATAYLFNNNHTPDNDDGVIDYTSATDIPFIPIGGVIYAAPTSVGGTAEMTVTPFTFTQTASVAQTIYGWYISDSSEIMLAERFSSPITMASSGDEVRITGHTFKLYSTP